MMPLHTDKVLRAERVLNRRKAREEARSRKSPLLVERLAASMVEQKRRAELENRRRYLQRQTGGTLI